MLHFFFFGGGVLFELLLTTLKAKNITNWSMFGAGT